MKAARVYEPGKMVIEELPLPELAKQDVLIRVHRVGLCGTDIGVKNGFVPARLPIVPGHEFSGTVTRMGAPSLSGLRVGDAVTAAGGWGCGNCELCQGGMGLFCKNRISLGRTVDGCLAEFVKVDHRAVFKLPRNVSFDEGQNFLNLACAIRAFKKAPLQLGKRVVVFGAGNIGLIILQILSLAGASQVVTVGTREFRLEMARRFGSNHVVNLNRDDPVRKIMEWYPNGADVVVEATGNAAAFQSFCEVIKPGGTLISLGMFHEKIKEFDPSFLYYKEPIIYGSKGAEGAHQQAIQLLEGKKIQVLPMITHRLPLEDAIQGFRVFEDKVLDALRIVIEPCE
jgi:2-desacetyl-2-hydroxyethyl bacteriochlorophyllide A dehydrogenase